MQSSPDTTKDTSYDQVSKLLQSTKRSDIVVIAGDMNAQVGKLHSSEACLGGRFGLPAQRTNNGDRLLQLCAYHNLFLSSTAFRHSSLQTATWQPNGPGPRTQIDRIAISYRWRSSIQNSP